MNNIEGFIQVKKYGKVNFAATEVLIPVISAANHC